MKFDFKLTKIADAWEKKINASFSVEGRTLLQDD